MVRILLLFLCTILLAACGQEPDVAYSTGDTLLRTQFDDPLAWDSRESGGVRIGVSSGAYRIRADVNSYVRGFYRAETYDDVVIDVQGLQFSEQENNAYGIICRGETGDDRAGGYYFLIGGDGSYSIRKGQFGEVDGLIKWARSGSINQGVATNTIRVVCVDDYLALYVNGEFMADARDDTFGSGYIGFAASVEQGEVIEVAFDNLTVLQGTLEE